jgi:glycosidase
MTRPGNPTLYQMPTRVWLNELAGALGRAATLDDIPDSALDNLARQSFDWVWLLGAWQTGPASRQVSLMHPHWRKEYQELLPDLCDEDICGSPFAVRAYEVHADFGSTAALKRLRTRLQKRGLRLMLDFVPNHTALDHVWVFEHPEFYVHGDQTDLAREPHNYRLAETRHGPRLLAHGRDPYFPGWPDTFQLNYRHAALREAMTAELTRVASLCDGIRCDMAMLLLPDVLARTWGAKSLPADGTAPVETSFWPEAIAKLRRQFPNFLFLAEVYWDLEWTLQQQGFDHTYDKRFYDGLRSRDAEAVRGHLWADLDFQRKLARFLENHDEPRAARTFAPAVHGAAAIVTYFVPGMRFFQEGQFEGRRVRLSMHLGRRPPETPDADLQDFYRRLLVCLKRPELQGHWQLLECRPAWDGNPTSKHFLAFAWNLEGTQRQRLLVTVNYGPTQGQCYVPLPFEGLAGRNVTLTDLMSDVRYERNGGELTSRGLYLDMPAWGYHVFEVTD